MTAVIDLGGLKMPERKDVTSARVSDIVRHAAELTLRKPADIMGYRRLPPLVKVRQGCYLVAREAGHSYVEIARRMNRQDHACAIAGAKTARLRELDDPAYAVFLGELRAKVKAGGRGVRLPLRPLASSHQHPPTWT